MLWPQTLQVQARDKGHAQRLFEYSVVLCCHGSRSAIGVHAN